jgi:threonine/homoserine/homoserine lactone efflux protein
MIELTTYAVFIAASAAVAIVPGPSVSVIVASSLRHGPRAGLMNIAGTQAGMGIMLLVLAFGFASVVQRMASVFDLVRFIGAAYLVYLGIRLWRGSGASAGIGETAPPGRGDRDWFLQGLLVVLSNPKVLVFFGAFIPQFVDPAGNPFWQVIFLGASFMTVALVLDSGYAFAAGRAGGWLTRRRVGLLEKISGTCLIGGGLWLALQRRMGMG